MRPATRKPPVSSRKPLGRDGTSAPAAPVSRSPDLRPIAPDHHAEGGPRDSSPPRDDRAG